MSSSDPSLTLLGSGEKGSDSGALRVGLFVTAVTEVGSLADCRRGCQEADSSSLRHWGAGRREAGPAAGDRAAKTERAEAMEGNGVPWGSEPVSGPGPGPGGGGMIRELCRGFGRYRRYLGRLRQNLRETQKFFRDIKCSHNHTCPSSPTGGGGAERGPADDVAETGLQAGKEGSPEGERAVEGNRRADRTPALQNKPEKRQAERGSRAVWPGPRAWAGRIRDALGGHPSEEGRRGPAEGPAGGPGARGNRGPEFPEQDPGDRGVR